MKPIAILAYVLDSLLTIKTSFNVHYFGKPFLGAKHLKKRLVYQAS
jgi:hypothetical protein